MSGEEENREEERSKRSEEGRVLVGLGLIAVAVAYRDELPNTFPFPLPYPTPHLQVFTLPIFNSAVLIFSIYATLMGIYFSGDIGGLTYFWRKLAQKTGHAFLTGYTFILFWSLVSTLGWLLLPNQLAIPYSIAYYLSVLYVVALTYDVLSDRWGRTNRLISRGTEDVYEAVKPHLIIEIARFWERRRNRLPKSLQRVVAPLAYHIGWGHTFNWRIRRAYVVMFPVLTISFFVTRQYELGAGASSDIAAIESWIELFVGMQFTMWVIVRLSREIAL